MNHDGCILKITMGIWSQADGSGEDYLGSDVNRGGTRWSQRGPYGPVGEFF